MPQPDTTDKTTAALTLGKVCFAVVCRMFPMREWDLAGNFTAAPDDARRRHAKGTRPESGPSRYCRGDLAQMPAWPRSELLRM